MKSQTYQISGAISTSPSNKGIDVTGIPPLIHLVSPMHSTTNDACSKEDRTNHSSSVSVADSSPTISPEFLQSQDKAQISLASICPPRNDTNNILPSTEITTPSANLGKDVTKGKGHMNCSWYSAYLNMQQRQHEIALGVEKCDDIEAVNEMLTHYSLVDLRQKLFLIQKQLCLYHTMMDQYEECKTQKNKLEEKNKNVVLDHKKCEDHLKKSRSVNKKLKKKLSEKDAQIMDLKMELAETKVHLAQSRSREDHQKFRVMKISEEKNRLEEENVSLRRTTSMNCLVHQDAEEDTSSVDRKGERRLRRICSMLSIPQAKDRQVMRRDTFSLSSSEKTELTSDPNSDTDESLGRTPSADENHDTIEENLTSQSEQDLYDPDPADSSPCVRNNFWNISALFNTSQGSLCEEDPTQDVSEKNHHDKLVEDNRTTAKKRRGQKWEESHNLLLSMQDSRISE